MSESLLRRIRPADQPALSALWAETFSDPPRLIADFFRLLPGMGLGFLAERDGEALGAAYLLTGLDLLAPDGEKRPVGYLYAVAVKPEARGRGLGTALGQACAQTARDLGCAWFCTQPAEARLFDWYAQGLALRCALYRREERLGAAALEACMELSATDYRYWRERMLAHRPHIRLGDAALQYQHSLCKSYGGGFFAVGDAVAAAYLDGSLCRIVELLSAPGTDRRSLAASLAARLGAENALLLSSASEGAPYIAADKALPEGCVWNLSLD